MSDYKSMGFRASVAGVLTAILVLIMLQSVQRCNASEWEKLDSIHFNGAHVDFGTIPRRGIVWYEHTDRPTGPDGQTTNGENPLALYELSHERDEGMKAWREKLFKALMHQASIQERKGHWSVERKALNELARRVGWTGGVRDRVEVLTRFARLPTPTQMRLMGSLRKYLGGMALAEQGTMGDAEEAFRKVQNDPNAGFLAEHALYQLASLQFQANDFKAAVKGYQELLRRYPNSQKTDSALIMIGRCSIIPAKTRADTIVGSDAVRRLLSEFPQSRFKQKAIGLLGRVHMLAGRNSDAVWCFFQAGDLASVETVRKQIPTSKAGKIRVWLFCDYLKRMAGARTWYSFEQTIVALDRLTKQLTGTDAFRLNVRITGDPEVAAAYLDYRLYHCDNTSRQLNNLAHLGEKIARVHAWRKLSPGVRVKLAELFYQHREYGRALQWANWAAVPAEFDRTHFVRGAALHKLHKTAAAIREYKELVKRFPSSSLLHGAREELALLYEVEGDRLSALKEYFRLGYKGDVAYIVDVRMSIPELEAYYKANADDKIRLWDFETTWGYDRTKGKGTKYTEKELIAYSLGIRSMRRELWKEAANWFRAVPRKAYTVFNDGRADYYKSSPDPLTAIREMSRLQRLTANAQTYNTKAAAAYKYASYYYKHGVLLLYNWALWQDDRRMDLVDFWNGRVANKSDENAVREHMYEHEVYARVLAMCKDIARRYPKSPTAPRALYRAACSADYISDFNEWWRTGHEGTGAKQRGDNLSRESVRLLKQIVQQYPKDPLAAPAEKFSHVFAMSRPSGRNARAGTVYLAKQ